MNKYDYLIVGAGLYGAVFAREACKRGKKILVIDKRPHTAGNIYTQNIDNIIVHKYGAHIFHTDNKRVWDYVNNFAEFNNFINSPVANYKGELYALPFNMHTFNKIWGVITPQEAEAKIKSQVKAAGIINPPKNLEEQAISLVGLDIYNKLIKGYTQKQWGRECKDLPAEIIKRIPVRFIFNNNYFNSRYQGVPVKGYADLVNKILDNKNIEIKLNLNYLEHKGELNNLAEKIIYTGQIDEFYDYKFGALEYRSLRFEHENLNINNFQGCAVMNYTDSETPYTRIIEHKWFNFGKGFDGEILDKTIISREYSLKWQKGGEAYYPVNDAKNNNLYNLYKNLAEQNKNIIFGGRLGEYKYYDMDAVINAALERAELEFN